MVCQRRRSLGERVGSVRANSDRYVLIKLDRKRLSADDLAQDEEAPPSKKPRKIKPYVATRRTGPYAILMALSSLPEDSLQSLSKAELIELAQPFCESSFTVPSESGKFYTAWNSITTLVNKDLVQERGRPLRKYNLTEEGWEAAKRIRTAEGDQITNHFEGNKPDDEKREKKAGSKTKPQKKAKPVAELGEALSDLETYQPPPVRLSNTQNTVTYSAASSSGQCLGDAPIDKFGTFPKTLHGSKFKPPRNANFIELLSSPEPPEIPSSAAAANRTSRALSTTSGNSVPPPQSKPPKPKSYLKPANPSDRASSTSPNAPRGPSQATSTTAVATIATTSSTSTLPTFTPITLPPGSFTIRLVLDNREIHSRDQRDYISDELTSLGHKPLIRPLPLGDIFWVAVLNDETHLARHGEAGTEIALDWIVERKRLDDLVGSITDGRFSEQKFRLRRSGVRNVVYLVEEITLSQEKITKFGEAITSAIASTQVVNNYFAKQTRNPKDSIRYLARLTTLLKAQYENKPLHIIPASALTPTTYLPLLSHLRDTEPRKNYNIAFPTFSSLASKSDTLTLRDVFLKMLMCTRGISGDKALAIQKVWRTPRAFMEAFEECRDEREREGMVEGRLGALVGRARIKGVLGKKVAGVWGME